MNDIFGGSIPRQFVPAIEKGIQDARMRGFLAGYPMVDFKATVFDGSFHAVDSNELFIDGLPIPVADRIGDEGCGFEYILHGLNPERILVAAEAVGLGRAALERAAA